MNLYKLGTLLVIALVGCGGWGNSQPNLAGTWNGYAYQVHDQAASSSTVWLQPLSINGSQAVEGAFTVQEYPSQTILESGSFSGTIEINRLQGGHTFKLNFPPRLTGEPGRFMRVDFTLSPDGRGAQGVAHGWGFGSDPQRDDFTFGMGRQ